MNISLFDSCVFDNKGRIVETRTRNEVRHNRFIIDHWTIVHVNKRSLTLQYKFNGEQFFVGARTLNEILRHERYIRYVKVPNPKNPGQVLNWIKIDTL